MPERIRDYNEDNRCTACGVHISEGHLPHCVLSNESAEYDWQPPIEVLVQCGEAAEIGKHYAFWIDFTQDRQELQEALDYFLSRSPVEGSKTIRMADYSGFYGLEATLGKEADVDLLHAVAQAIEEYGEPVAAWLEAMQVNTENVSALVEAFPEHYLGEYQSRLHYIMELLAEVDAESGTDPVTVSEVLRGLAIVKSRAGTSVFRLQAAERGGVTECRTFAPAARTSISARRA